MRIRIQLFISMRIRIKGAKQMRTQTDPCPDPRRTLKSQKLNFNNEKKTKSTLGKGSKTYYEGTKAFSKGRKPGLFVHFDQFPCSWIRNQDSQINADPCGSGSTTLLQT
jgi:hypothetical protein